MSDPDRVADPVVGDPERTAASAYLAATAPRASLDRLAKLAARLLKVSSAQISLVAEEPVVAGVHGVAADDPGTSVDESLCTVTVGHGTTLAIVDAAADA